MQQEACRIDLQFLISGDTNWRPCMIFGFEVGTLWVDASLKQWLAAEVGQDTHFGDDASY